MNRFLHPTPLFFFAALLLIACSAPQHRPAPQAEPPRPTVSASASPLPPSPPTLRPTQAAVCAETEGKVETGSIETRLLDKPMRYRVYLPPCYNAQAQTRYPSLYLLHGQNFDEEQWQRIGAFRTADALITSGQVPPFLIILPYDYSSKQPTQYGFAQVFTEMLLPQIDSTYRTQTQSEFRAIGGLSRGAGWALHLGIRNPQIFGAIGAHSPAVFYSDWTTLRYRLHDSDRNTFPPVFVDAGEHDSGYENILTLVALLNEMNIPHEWHAYQGYHEEKYWSAHVDEYLRWYAARWQNN